MFDIFIMINNKCLINIIYKVFLSVIYCFCLGVMVLILKKNMHVSMRVYFADHDCK